MKLLQTIRSSGAIGSTFGGTAMGQGSVGGANATLPGAAQRIVKLVVAQNSSAASTIWASIRYGQSSASFSSLDLVPCGSSFRVDSFDVNFLVNAWDFISGSSEIAVQVWGA